MKKNPWRFLSAGAVALMLAAPLNFPVSAAGGDVLVTPFTGVEIENSALNVSAEKVQPLGNGLDGSKITIQADLDPIDNKNFVFPGHHNDRAKVITGKGAIAGSTGLVVYVEMPTANKFCFFANINSPHDDRWNNDFDADMMQTVDSAYRLLPVGGSCWEDCKAGKGKISDDVGYGCVEFDEAFKGWVYIPWDSLWVDIGFELDISKDTLHAVTMYPQKVGGDAGSLTFGPVYLATANGETLLTGGGDTTPDTTTTPPQTTTVPPEATTTSTTASTEASTTVSTTGSTESSATTSPGDEETGLPAGAIAAIVIGIVIVLAGAGAALYFLVIRKKPEEP